MVLLKNWDKQNDSEKLGTLRDHLTGIDDRISEFIRRFEKYTEDMAVVLNQLKENLDIENPTLEDIIRFYQKKTYKESGSKTKTVPGKSPSKT